MFPTNYITLPHALILLFAFLLYYLGLAFLYKKHLLSFIFKVKDANPLAAGAGTSRFPHTLIDKPFDHRFEGQSASASQEVLEEDDLLFDDEENDAPILLREAEDVVEQIQDVVNHIASNPPNPDELFSKVKAILGHYSIFQNTEYYEAINSFISITVDRDCSIKWNNDQLENLWKQE